MTTDAKHRLPQALGERIDIRPAVEALRPLILEAEPEMEVNSELPAYLVEAMYEVGLFHTIHPREFGGLELHPLDYLDLIFELSRINASVGWIAVIQCGVIPLLAPDVMHELYARADGRWIVSGSHGRVGQARPVDGGYRFTGHWAFASGSPWSTYITAMAKVIDDDDQPIEDPTYGGPMYVTGVFPKAAVDYIGGWNSLGLRGTGSGQFRLDDVFVESDFTATFETGDDYLDRALFRASGADGGVAAVSLGCAQGAIDQFIELTHRPKRADSALNRQASLGTEQLHQVRIAQADSMLKAAKSWVWDHTEERYANAFCDDETYQYEMGLHTVQSTTYAARVSKEIVDLVFDQAGTDSVIVGRGIERRFRDVHTAAQHTVVLENSYTAPGQYYLTRDLPTGAVVDAESSTLPPPPAPQASVVN